MRTVLFVDDEAAVGDGLRRILRSAADRWQTAYCSSGDEALALLATAPVDVVVSDLRMPGMSGAEFLRRVSERHPRTARILLTGSALNAEETAMLGDAAQARLVKPCSRDELLATLDRLCP